MNWMKRSLVAALFLLCTSFTLNTAQILEEPSRLHHYIYFGLDRERIAEADFLENTTIVGAQLKYTWRELEPQRDEYALDEIIEALDYLEAHGKRLFIQIQDVSFRESIINVPDYLLNDPAFNGGVARQYSHEDDDEDEMNPIAEGWVARRWDPAVQRRFIKLLDALGEQLDGRIEGLNLPETSIGFGDSGRLHPEGYSHVNYYDAVKVIMTAAGKAFVESHVIQYANFMPGESLPAADQGYLKGIYAHADAIGVGVGGPDLRPHRWWQRQHSYPLIAKRGAKIIAGLAVQWGNLDDRNRATGEQVTVAELCAYARDPLRLDYVFWGTQDPYYSEDVLPFLEALGARR